MTIEGIPQGFGGDGIGGTKRLCPFVQSPLDDCFLTSMESQNIEKILDYCGGNYEQCDIYKKNSHWMY